MKIKFKLLFFAALLAVFLSGCAAKVEADLPGSSESEETLEEDLSGDLSEEPAEDEEALPAVLFVAYSKEGQLMLSVGYNAPRALTTGHQDIDPVLSPDGTKILFKRVSGTGPAGHLKTDLWLINSDGTGAQMLVAADDLPGEMGYVMENPEMVMLERLPMQISFTAGGTGVIFNTELNVDYGLHPFNDLWHVNLETGTTKQVLNDGAGGVFALSPKGDEIMVANHEQVSVMKADFTEQRVLLDYPAVNTASEFLFIPTPVWEPAGKFALVAIPDPDPYAHEESLPELAIWELSSKEGARLRSTVFGHNLGPAMHGSVFSPDGEHFVYSTGHFPEGSTHVATLDGDVINTYEYFSDFLGWSTDGRLVILFTDVPFLGGLDTELIELPMHEDVEAWSAFFEWVGPLTYVGLDYSYFLEETVLWVTTIEGESRIIDYECDSFDALLVK